MVNPHPFLILGMFPTMFNLKIYNTMVRIVDYAVNENSKGEKFCALIVQGGLESVVSKKTKRSYFTARKANVACTFDEETCKSLVGTELPGKIMKIQVEPYQYKVPETEEEITLTHSWRYMSDEDAVIQEQVEEGEEIL